ncbi:uncharacterized protein N7458_005932 [Penicillium daleae]|uniref:Subtelomeric hrmA-associated cluster protein AFUB-079030/YDR124W-like helical bundle domain-containing protein n=1 Tax=Penicillium daleae TaxID=63821 RepID=A0AAD6C650_9EURO|nr:uncharacterized protein N7458_005932 [Penicillium daleae]KAJ5449483.1 hypothetical protein N7458_005932 [Penicillium daleae]
MFNMLPFTHFALIYMDADGTVHIQASESIANSCHEILWTKVMDAFLRAVASSEQATITIAKTSRPSQLTGISNFGINSMSEAHMQNSVPIANSFQPINWPTHRRCWPSLSSQGLQHNWNQFYNKDANISRKTKTMISVRDRNFLGLYYTVAFNNLQQTSCRILAKAYIKLVEPRKQVNYPYNGRKFVAGTLKQLDPDMTKPPWWPLGVIHREPGHLPKVGGRITVLSTYSTQRIRLLVHILRELRFSHGISVSKLKEASQLICHQITPERLQILDEIYEVRREEENFLDGISGR